MNKKIVNTAIGLILIAALASGQAVPFSPVTAVRTARASALCPRLCAEAGIRAETVIATVLAALTASPKATDGKRVRMLQKNSLVEKAVSRDVYLAAGAAAALSMPLFAPAAAGIGVAICIALSLAALVGAAANLRHVIGYNFRHTPKIKDFLHPLMTVSRGQTVVKVIMQNATNINQAVIVLLLRAAAAGKPSTCSSKTPSSSPKAKTCSTNPTWRPWP